MSVCIILTAKPKISQLLSYLTSNYPWTLLTSHPFEPLSSSSALSTTWNSSLPAHLPASVAVVSTQPLFIGVPQGSALEPLLPFICSPSLGASIHTHVINQMLVTSKLLSSPFVYLSIWHHHEMFWRYLKPKHTPQTWTTFGVCFSVNGTTPTIYLVPLPKI